MDKTQSQTISGDYIAGFVDGEGCFDLQFRRDVRRERKNKPVYYGWKCQFVIVTRKDDEDLLKKIQTNLGYGAIYLARGDQVRYSVQDIDNLHNITVPFFRRNSLHGKKKQDFELWAEAIEIIYRNKGKFMRKWVKSDFTRIINIHESMQKFKAKRPQGLKWISIARSITETIK